MLDINIYDLLAFEDDVGNIYQDCVCEIDNCKNGNVYKLNSSVYKENNFIEELIIFNYKYDTFVNNYVFSIDKKNTYKLKEVWHKADKSTYKKVWDKDIKQKIKIGLQTWDEVRLYIDELVKDGQIEKDEDIDKFEFTNFSQDRCKSVAHNCLISYNNR